jgi:GntR family transcriptional repressor for pyruvate dehydrogenase complex
VDIRPVSRVTVADQVLDQLGSLILEGKIMPGAKLPNERELAQMFDTTRGRVREALRALALIGLIVTRPGDGSYVASGTKMPPEALELMFFREARKYDDLYQARQLLEPPLYALALQHVADSDIVKLHALLDEGERVAYGSRSPEEFLEIIDQYDEIIVQLTHNVVLDKLMTIFRTMSHDLFLKLLRVPGAMLNSLDRRREITEALKLRDAERVRIAVNRHMDSARDYYRAGMANNVSE